MNDMVTVKELAERYIDRLSVANELMLIMESTSKAYFQADNEIKSLEQQLIERGVEIKDIEQPERNISSGE